MTVVELCGLRRGSIDRALRGIVIDGREHLDAALRLRGSALVVTAHLGNWELLSLLQRVVDRPVAIVVRPLDAPWLDTFVERLRSATGVAIIAKHNAVRPILEALKRGGVIAILLDQNAARREGVFVPFFGRSASTSRSIAAIATRTGTPVLPVFIRREGSGRHRVTMHPALTALSGVSHEEAIVDLTARCTAIIEREIRSAPEQWLWFHDRWRTRPASERADAS